MRRASSVPVRSLRLVLGDQLSRSIAALRDLDPERDVVLMAEVIAECTYVPHHPKKIGFVLSAMRHFTEELQARGVRVDYRRLDDAGNTGSLAGELEAAARRHRPQQIVVTEPGEWRLRQDMLGWQERIGIPVELRADGRFLCSRDAFTRWARGRRQPRMEFFYREMRRRTGLLMEAGGVPAGGRWNFDADNRKRLPTTDDRSPLPRRFAPDPLTREVLALVDAQFGHHFGDAAPFWFAVTAGEAEEAFERFVIDALPRFGDYQDAMKAGEPFLYHSVVSLYINTGLLDPLAVCRRVEDAWRRGLVPLNAAEGFIRQIIGWREYVRGIYWLKMPAYAETNFFAADRPLPAFYWSGETTMNCMKHCIDQTRREAYAHHIQRLMVTGLFALLAGIDPKAVCEWYLAVYADAYEWVELPNTHGLALFADGGVLGSKPYAASGKYIDRMSDYCRGCVYDVAATTGPEACPFNVLYWNFLAAHRVKLAVNPRLRLSYQALDRMGEERLAAVRAQAKSFLDGLGSG